jgi:phosphatidylserine/phosphatidylglycerophosphate/cardiolipin synthase-like enzyme
MRRLLPLLLLLALGFPTSLAPAAQIPTLPPVQVFFGPKAADDPRGLYFNLMRFLDSAHKSIYGSVHEVDMITIAEKLAEKAKAGVDVQIVVENDWWGGAKNKAARQVLERSKVKVFPDTKKSGLMHNKFFIADGKRVWTGSTNLTETCLLYNPNNSVWIEDARLAANFSAEFAEERAGKFGKKGSGRNNTPHPDVALSDTLRIETYFSPEDTPIPAIVALIDSAAEEIDLMCFVFSSREICDALLAARKRGVKVRVLLDNVFSSKAVTKRWDCVPFKELKDAGVPCKYDDEHSKLHHKVIIVDRKRVLTGSFNFSANAANENDENALVIHSRAVARRYRTEFDRLWNYYNGDPGQPPPPEKEDGDG